MWINVNSHWQQLYCWGVNQRARGPSVAHHFYPLHHEKWRTLHAINCCDWRIDERGSPVMVILGRTFAWQSKCNLLRPSVATVEGDEGQMDIRIQSICKGNSPCNRMSTRIKMAPQMLEDAGGPFTSKGPRRKTLRRKENENNSFTFNCQVNFHSKVHLLSVNWTKEPFSIVLYSQDDLEWWGWTFNKWWRAWSVILHRRITWYSNYPIKLTCNLSALWVIEMKTNTAPCDRANSEKWNILLVKMLTSGKTNKF